MAVLESIATISLLGHRSLHGRISVRDIPCKQESRNYRLPVTEFTGKGVVLSLPLPRLKGCGLVNSSIEARAIELTKEVHAYREERKSPRKWKDEIDAGIDQKPDLWPPENRVDKPSLHNPLLRQERMGCGWLAAIFEWEGVIINDNPELEKQAWLALAEEEGKSPPPAFTLRRIEGMKNEQAISEILCWSREPALVKRMAARKEDIYQALQGGVYRFCAGSSEFVDVLMNYKIPMALVSTRPRKTLETAIRTIGIEGCFSAIVAAEDVCRGKPDPEMFVYAAQLLEFAAERCIVFGNSNQTVEAARDAQMKCVAVANRHRVYELGAADLVVRRLDELSIVDLKNLADIEPAEFGSGKPKPEMEMEKDEEEDGPSASTAMDDSIFW
ncbi:5-amino-6-(5-phospho-D-ribitylamino)uracil phosphatase, chloroplastic-like [Durio zibethinus]|uniref:5-amino-6-(5-phospho-D-ribitylamino)uracil phosphatase, chloroplastic-like n=1 Tax=Durio zibethinus TaxID=66656 RepID=A0A6P5YCT2_DURZI|nr:5-amino-6-(5-phospho-D-ribitylamino)uracil phosphatase, chloroplastic-like [Durio zibethinus]